MPTLKVGMAPRDWTFKVEASVTGETPRRLSITSSEMNRETIRRESLPTPRVVQKIEARTFLHADAV